MLNITFVLKDKGSANKSDQKETPIICYIRYNAQRLKFPTGERILPRHWDDRKDSKKYQRAKSTLTGHPEFNARLDKIEATVKQVFRKYQNEHHNENPSIETLRTLLNREFKRTDETPKTFLGFFESMIKLSRNGVRMHPKTGKPLSPNTLKTYVTTFKHLTEFQTARRKKIDFDSIDLDFYSDYTEYLMKGKRADPKTGKAKPINLSTNTIGKHIQIIKLILNEATERGLNKNLAYKSKRFVTVREKSDSIYLTDAEIKEIEALDLSDNIRLERVRDLFLIGCYTGLRYSDYSILKPENIKDHFIETTQIKTGEPVTIPVHEVVEKIIKKYEGSLPHSISNQKTNDYLKELGKRFPCLKAPFPVTFTKGGVKITENFAKWELLTTHTARRSFATNMYLLKVPVITIMAVTGHKTEKAFMKYIKLNPYEHARVMKAHWENLNQLRAV